ncbi:MAG: phytanoyl-CoA dioxygenase family protein [Burkholderiales bacterium]
MPATLARPAVEAFRRDGYLFPHRVVAPEVAAQVARAVLAFAAGGVPKHYPDPQNQLYLLKAHLLFDWADRLSHEAALLDAIESLIGPDILLWSSGVFWKSPHSGSYVSWHQDATNYELDDADHVVRAWLSLTPSSEANGTMKFLPGGHRLGAIAHVDRMAEGELLSRGETIDLAIDESRAVPVVVDAGEVSFHHLHTPHASGPNGSEHPRVNYVMTFIAPRVKPRVGPDSAQLVRGSDKFGHFEHEPRPTRFYGDEALQVHQRYMAMRYPILFRGARPPPLPQHAAVDWSGAATIAA